MRFISTKVHGVLDYLVGAALIGIPWLLGFTIESPETWVPVALGGSTLFYSLLTNYEPGLIKLLPMPVHLIIDFLSGVLLAASPWLFEFAGHLYIPHVAFGAAEIIITLLTRTVPGKKSAANQKIKEGHDSTLRKSPWVTKESRGPWVTPAK
jgi:hypothetical protein